MAKIKWSAFPVGTTIDGADNVVGEQSGVNVIWTWADVLSYIAGGGADFLVGNLQLGATDTNLSRISAGVVGVGTGAQGSVAGTLRATNIDSTTTSSVIFGGATISTPDSYLYAAGNILAIGASGTVNALFEWASQKVFVVSSEARLGWSSATSGSGNAANLRSGLDTILTRAAAASLQLGAADAASPVAQTLQVQSVVAGNSNVAGAAWTIKASAGTGNANSGKIEFQVAPAGGSGTSQNSFATLLSVGDASGGPFADAYTIGFKGPSGNNMWFGGNLTGLFDRWVINIGGTGIGYIGGPNSSITAGAFGLAFAAGTSSNPRAYIINPATATLQFGTSDAASPVAQTLQVQSVVAGNSNVAGADWTFKGSASTGNVDGGNFIFRTTPAGGSGTSQNAFATSGILGYHTDSDSGPFLSTPGTSLRFATGTNAAGTDQLSNGNYVKLSNSGFTLQGLANAHVIWQLFSDYNSSTAAFKLATAAVLGWTASSFNATTAADTMLSRAAAATLQLGDADADTNAAIVAQTLRSQGLLTGGTNNQAGKDWTFIASPGKGTGAGGSFLFQTAPAGGSGNAVNSPVTVMALTSTGALTLSSTTKLFGVSTGNLKLTNNNETDFGQLMFGGENSSYPALVKNGTGLQVKLADGSAYAPFSAELVTVAAGTATPAHGSTAAKLLFGTTAGFGIYYGSDTPTVSAAKGSLYLRSDGTGVADRAYINSDGGTTWVSIATSG